QLRHRPGLDLADALTGEVEVLADLLEGAGLAAVESETQLEDLALAVVERSEQARDLVGQQGRGRHLERRLGPTVLDHLAQPAVAYGAPELPSLGGGDVLAAAVEVQTRVVAGLDGLGEAHLVVLGEQWVLPDVGEVQPDEVFLVPLDTFLGHRVGSFSRRLTAE